MRNPSLLFFFAAKSSSRAAAASARLISQLVELLFERVLVCTRRLQRRLERCDDAARAREQRLDLGTLRAGVMRDDIGREWIVLGDGNRLGLRHGDGAEWVVFHFSRRRGERVLEHGGSHRLRLWQRWWLRRCDRTRGGRAALG